jgi:hypothetical protein
MSRISAAFGVGKRPAMTRTEELRVERTKLPAFVVEDAAGLVV